MYDASKHKFQALKVKKKKSNGAPKPIAPSPAALVAAPPAPAMLAGPAGAKGLRDYGVAPSSRALCLVCGLAIKKGDFRLDYRVKASTSLRDQRRLHVACVDRLPDETRETDLLKLQGWAGDDTLPADTRASLQEAYERLRGF